MQHQSTTRIRLIFYIFLVFAAVLIGRLFYLQTVRAGYYREQADNQYVRPAPDKTDRGKIMFTYKTDETISAATLGYGYEVIVDPGMVKDAEALVAALAGILPDIDRADIKARALRSKDRYESVAERIDKETAQKINALNIPGLGAYQQTWRLYPGGMLAAHVLGFVGYQGNDLSGRYGLERYYNDVLSRKNSYVPANFFVELFSNIADSILYSENEHEGDIVSSIEPNVQAYAESVLKETHDVWRGDEGGMIVVDPKTGRIYAMAAFPAFDPNVYGDVKDEKVFVNPLVERVYEMGSIIKPLTMAAGLDAGVITPQTTYNDTGTIVLNSSRISNYDGKARGVVPMQEVLSQSLNVGVSFIAGRLGHEKMRTYFRELGIDQETGIDLPNEVHGLADNLDSPRDIEYATASFGQGVAMTPIEAAMALSTLANGGKLMTPMMVDRIEYADRLPKKIYPDEGKRVFNQETTEEVTRMLVTVVDKALAGGKLSQPHHSIAAKTGTAQISNPAGGGYYEDRYLHSFFGYFPAYDPKFLVFIYHVYPKGAKYASETLTTPFGEMSKFLISYYEIPPDR
ncbi:MAG: penicillin-binding protein 2 [Candidatus Yonathbacteria bacterium]|nr:penicillin-binding protein 2 [Candidatus Yonathbacteria bacterium]